MTSEKENLLASSFGEVPLVLNQVRHATWYVWEQSFLNLLMLDDLDSILKSCSGCNRLQPERFKEKLTIWVCTPRSTCPKSVGLGVGVYRGSAAVLLMNAHYATGVGDSKRSRRSSRFMLQTPKSEKDRKSAFANKLQAELEQTWSAPLTCLGWDSSWTVWGTAWRRRLINWTVMPKSSLVPTISFLR